MLSLSEPTEIGATLTGAPVFLAPMTPAAAGTLGEAFSAIDPWVRYPFTAQALSTHLGTNEPGAPRYVLHAENETAGTMTLRLNWLSGPYLQFFGVVPSFQGQGIGSLVLSWLEAGARAEKARNLWVAASDFNAGAIRLYERHGFKRVALIDNLVSDGRDEVLLRKRL